MLEYYLSQLQSPTPTIPVIIDELSAFECVSRFSGIHITSFEDIHEMMPTGVYIYEKPEDKKQLWVTEIRRWIDEVSLQPYSEKALYILRGFDTASIEAQNATLKLLEEPPTYAIILLIVENPESILETIHSRTITLFRPQSRWALDQDVRLMLEGYFHWDESAFLRYLYEAKYDITTAIAILRECLRFLQGTEFQRFEQSLIDLFHVNENPRNILDRVFLTNTI